MAANEEADAVAQALERRAHTPRERRTEIQLPQEAKGRFWPTLRWVTGCLRQDKPMLVLAGTAGGAIYLGYHITKLVQHLLH